MRQATRTVMSFHQRPRLCFLVHLYSFQKGKTPSLFQQPTLSSKTLIVSLYFVVCNKTLLLCERFPFKRLQFVSIYRTEHILSSCVYGGVCKCRASFCVLAPENSFA